MGNISSWCGGETSSRCVTKTATGAHKFEVTNYSLLDGMGAGNCVSSNTFSVGGGDWCINFFPDAYSGCAFACLCLQGTAKEPGVMVKSTLSFLGSDGKPYKGTEPVTATRTLPFSHVGIEIFSGWEDRVIVEKCKLQADGCFTIRCDLTVMRNTVA
ncbi:hypothetical protein ACQJBY_011860 [Aegilops geniculata]